MGLLNTAKVLRKEANLMNHQGLDYERALGIEWMLTADTGFAVLAILVAIWMWAVMA